jgi:hypothetical protein
MGPKEIPYAAVKVYMALNGKVSQSVKQLGDVERGNGETTYATAVQAAVECVDQLPSNSYTYRRRGGKIIYTYISKGRRHTRSAMKRCENVINMLPPINISLD